MTTKINFNQIKGASINVLDYGADPTGVTECAANIQAAITAAAAAQVELYLPAGTYKIATTLTIPVNSNNYVRFSMRGESAYQGSETTGLPGTVIFTTSDITAIKTPTLTAPNNTIAYWAKFLEISDIYVMGTLSLGLGMTDTGSRGFNLSGVEYLKAHNLHAEGFGAGLRIENGSEIYITGTHIYQNNYYGAYLYRSSVSTTDLQAWADNLVCVNNYIPLVLRAVRSVWIKSGEFITYGASSPLTGRTAVSRIYVETSSNTEIHFSCCTFENDESTPIVSIDSGGVSVFEMDKCSFESCIYPVIETSGFFDSIAITNSAFERTTLAGGAATPAIIHLAMAGTTDASVYANNICMNGNSPSWASFMVLDDSVNKSPYRDQVGGDYQQVNPRRELDQAGDNQTVPAGNWAFTSNNVLVGKGRMYWNDAVVANNFLFLYPPRALKGIDTLWVTIICDDNLGATVPIIYDVGGIGTSPGSWQMMSQTKLASFTVGARTFSKWGMSIAILNKTTSFSTGVTYVELSNIYSTSGGTANGAEYCAIYVPTVQSGVVEANKRIMAAAPSTGQEGIAVVGDLIFYNIPAAGKFAMACTVAGAPGTWVNV